MKYQLVGGSYGAITPAAAAQTCVNLIAEPIEDKSESAKGGWLLVGAPGKHLFKDLTVIDAAATPYRGGLMVNGRLFVAAGTKFFEVSSAGALVGSVYTIADDATHTPVTMYTNGGAQQIMVMSASLCYVYDGFSINIIDLPAFTGIVDTDGKTVYYSSGDTFDPSMTAQPIVIHSRSFTVDQVLSADVLTVTATIAMVISAATNAAAVELTTASNHGLSTGDGVTLSGFTLAWLTANATWTATVTAVNKFTIPLDSTGFGALTGSPLMDYYNAAYASTIPHMKSISGAFLDTYFVVAREDSVKVNVSPSNDGANNGTWIWSQLDFKNKESRPGYLRSVLAANEQLYVFAVDGYEVWQTATQGNDPFTRIDGATGSIGSISKWGPIGINGQVFYIGGAEGGIVAYKLNGFTPVRISTYAEEYAWNAASLGADCVSYTYLEEGHTFWGINFGSQTWVYDLTTGLWAQRYGWNGSAFTAYGTKYHTFAQNSHSSNNDWGTAGKHLVGGDGTGKIYEQSLSFYDEAGADMKQQRTVPYQYAEGKRIYFNRQTLEMETGTIASKTIASATAASPAVLTKVAHGLTTGNIISISGATGLWAPLSAVWTITVLSADTFSVPLNATGFGALTGTVVVAPTVSRSYSDNRGATFTTPQPASMGPHDESGFRVFWPLGGSSYNRLWRYEIVGQSKVGLVCIDSDQGAGVN